MTAGTSSRRLARSDGQGGVILVPTPSGAEGPRARWLGGADPQPGLASGALQHLQHRGAEGLQVLWNTSAHDVAVDHGRLVHHSAPACTRSSRMPAWTSCGARARCRRDEHPGAVADLAIIWPAPWTSRIRVGTSGSRRSLSGVHPPGATIPTSPRGREFGDVPVHHTGIAVLAMLAAILPLADAASFTSFTASVLRRGRISAGLARGYGACGGGRETFSRVHSTGARDASQGERLQRTPVPPPCRSPVLSAPMVGPASLG
jgi:hypothetical protein